MRGVLVCVTLASLLVSGCVTPAKTETSTSGSTAPGTLAPSASGTATTAPSATTAAATTTAATASNATAANHAPAIVAFAANATGLAVRFLVNATDADGDALSFNVTFGDGTNATVGALPAANLTHAYAAAGNYTVHLAVSDGHAAANATLVVAVVAVGAAGPSGPVDHRECTGVLGNSPVGLTINNGANSVGGCSFGKIEADMTVLAMEQVDGCTQDVSPDGSSSGYGTPNEVGKTWKAGAAFRIVCDLGTLDLSGSIDFVPA